MESIQRNKNINKSKTKNKKAITTNSMQHNTTTTHKFIPNKQNKNKENKKITVN